ncbi:MAG TPA: type II toxin-antitoxin system RelE/ParE family toxin [Acidobacteriaceae bacterium]
MLYSSLAEADLLGIGEFTLRNWGPTQADRYLTEIEDCCERLGTSPSLGRACDEIHPGLHRIEQGKHVIFYRQDRRGILVSRILHQSMLPARHPVVEDEP